MMTKEELEAFDKPCQYIKDEFQPCVLVESHLEALMEIAVCTKAFEIGLKIIQAEQAKVERLEKELAMYKGNINVKQDFRNLRKMDKTKIGSAKLEAK